MKSDVYLDVDCTKSLISFFAYGIDPGSFCQAMLRNDLSCMAQTRHPCLEDEVVGNMMDMIRDEIPEVSYRDIEAWMAHNGLSGAPDSVRVEVALHDDTDAWFISLVRARFPEVF